MNEIARQEKKKKIIPRIAITRSQNFGLGNTGHITGNTTGNMTSVILPASSYTGGDSQVFIALLAGRQFRIFS